MSGIQCGFNYMSARFKSQSREITLHPEAAPQTLGFGLFFACLKTGNLEVPSGLFLSRQRASMAQYSKQSNLILENIKSVASCSLGGGTEWPLLNYHTCDQAPSESQEWSQGWFPIDSQTLPAARKKLIHVVKNIAESSSLEE